MKLSWIAQVLGNKLQAGDCDISGFCVDSRELNPGEVFVVLSSDDVDGHEFVEAAYQKGAKAALVEREVDSDIPQIKVSNTQKALILLAQKWRDQFSIPMIAITGSCGKTSTRALAESIFSACGETLASIKSFNNSIGVPLTILRLRPKHQYAVFEVGANHPGEIAELVALVKPSVALITLAAPSHLAGFGSLEGIAKAKGEIYQGLGDNGVGIINQDDQFADFWRKLILPKRTLSFGLTHEADVMADNISFNQDVCPHFSLLTPMGGVEVQLNLIGRHNIYNALAAATAASALSIPLEKIKQGLELGKAESRRLVSVQGYAQARVIDDSYNANPASVKAAIDVLVHLGGTSILVLGDMGELGASADQLHHEIGECANKAGIRHLFCYGSHSRITATAFGEKARHFDSQQALIEELRPLLNQQVTVLVKGSNSMGMHHITQSLLEE